MIRKLALIAFVSIACAATNEIVIQPLLRSAAEYQPASPLALATALPRLGGSGASGMAVPVSGFIVDRSHRGLLPIIGLRLNAFIGQLIALGGEIDAAISSPNQNYVVIIGDGAATLWLTSGTELAQASLPADVTLSSSAIPSPGGFSLALASTQRGLLQIFSMLPNQPQLAATLSFADLGGTPKTVAVSDDAAVVLYSINDGTQDWVYVWSAGKSPALVTSAVDVSSLAFAPASHSALIADRGANLVYLVNDKAGLFVPVPIASIGAGLSQPVAADFSRDAQRIIVANAGSQTIQSFGFDGTPLGSAPCNCAPRFLHRMIGNAVFGITEYDGGSIAMFDGDSNPPLVTSVSSTHDISRSLAGRLSAAPAAATGTSVSAVLSATPPAANCATPVQQMYYSSYGSSVAPYAWFNPSSIPYFVYNMWAQARTCAAFTQVGTCTGGSLTGSAIQLIQPSVSASCFYSPTPLLITAPGTYQVAFFVDQAGGNEGSEVAAGSEPIFTIADANVNLALVGARALLSSGGLNQQLLSVGIGMALPEDSAITIAPSFIADSGVANVVPGNPTYDCRFVSSPVSVTTSVGQTQAAVSITIAAGQTQAPVSTTISAGTVAGTCTFSATSMAVGPQANLPVSGSAQLFNTLDPPFISQATLTAQGNPFTIQIAGWATRRTLSSITFTFTPKSGTTISSGPITTAVGPQAEAFFTSVSSSATGGSFLYNQQFSVGNGGTSSNIQSVVITVNDGLNASNSFSVPFP